MTDILLITLIFLALVNIILTLFKRAKVNVKPQLADMEAAVSQFYVVLDKSSKDTREEFRLNREENGRQAYKSREELTKSLQSFELNFKSSTAEFGKQQLDINKVTIEGIKEVKDTIEKHLRDIREDNNKQITEMRKTVDEKLQSTLEKRIGESFKQVSDRLELVHKGLGEMQTIATGVGDLKKVLSNVKTRGVLGEYQLGNILEEILVPGQYGKNVATKKGSQGNVEYAVKLPGQDSSNSIWLPIDSKFPIESYNRLLAAYESGDKAIIDVAQKELTKTVESFAKDIHNKYIDPPHTTDFAIMFLPVESLYGEVLRHPGLFETLQRKYKITVTGPTTLSALLNSLQMGFRTLAVQKKSSEVWKVLEAVKTEFGKFEEQLDNVYGHLNKASNSLDVLKTTRTNVMLRKLKDVGSLNSLESKATLEIESDEDDPLRDML
ncbi:MAG: DNA recombination protein RmuC [Spirochaetia bacterium]|jgi:DNA recombination protein RmuC|nr:DNA recombination protein RmuC [Spirochaetia bacterium]